MNGGGCRHMTTPQISQLVTRAVYIDLAEGYSTYDFLCTLKRFVHVHGWPSTMHSDRGTQLVAANKELEQMMRTWDVEAVRSFGSNNGVTWHFNKSADAPWENGCSEALIKSIKKCLGIYDR